jgi:hypothetical protein
VGIRECKQQPRERLALGWFGDRDQFLELINQEEYASAVRRKVTPKRAPDLTGVTAARPGLENSSVGERQTETLARFADSLGQGCKRTAPGLCLHYVPDYISRPLSHHFRKSATPPSRDQTRARK